MNEPLVSSSSSSNFPVTDDNPIMNRRHDSPDHSIHGNQAPVLKGGDATVNDRTGLYIAIISIVFSAMAFGTSIILPMVYSERMESLRDRVQLAERDAALAREDVRVMQQALAAKGIQTDPHEQEKK